MTKLTLVNNIEQNPKTKQSCLSLFNLTHTLLFAKL